MVFWFNGIAFWCSAVIDSNRPLPTDSLPPNSSRSRGGLSTKSHMVVRGLDCLVWFRFTACHRDDAPQAGPLIEGLPAEVVGPVV
jgi:hypothetical protein